MSVCVWLGGFDKIFYGLGLQGLPSLRFGLARFGLAGVAKFSVWACRVLGLGLQGFDKFWFGLAGFAKPEICPV